MPILDKALSVIQVVIVVSIPMMTMRKPNYGGKVERFR